MASRIEICALRRSRRWGEVEGRAAVAAWRASGLSMCAFAAAHGLVMQRISWWRKRLGRTAPARLPSADLALLPIDVVVPRGDAEPAIEIAWGEVVVRVRRGTDEATLGLVLRALATARC